MAVRLEGLSWGAQAGAATRRILALLNEANQLVREYYLAPFRMGVAPPPSPWPQGAVDAAPSQSN